MPVRSTAILLSIASLVATSPAQSSEPAPLPPPYEGTYQPHGVDEVGMWREDDERERALAASPVVIRDEALTSYIQDLLCRTVGTDRCSSIRTYIIREPTFNATMSPNGTMRVFSGLLLRARSEAELAAVLGHEFGHFERRHGLERFRATRRGTDTLAWSALLASMSRSYQVRQTYQNLQFSIYGDLFRYARDHEREADILGLGYLNASELRPQAAAEVWQNLMNELEASAAVRGLRKPNFKSIAFTASHPPEGERAEYLSELALPEADERDDGAERYQEALSEWLPIFLEDQIKLNDFGASDYIITNLAENGWTANLWYARGELFRTRGAQRDMVNAIEFYSNAIELNSTFASAYRGLGLSLIKTGRKSEGQEALLRYLALEPEADDAKLIQMMVPKEMQE